MTIRPATDADLPMILGVETAAFAQDALPFFHFRQMLDAVPAFFLVADDGGRLGGYVLGSMQAGEAHGWLLSLAVSPDFRGRGIGEMLVRGLLEAFASKGAAEARLHVSPSNRGALALYRKLGFEEVRVEADYFGPGADRAIMRRAAGAP
jgi:ribosomal-protein-alanine N-acetyltransferase